MVGIARNISIEDFGLYTLEEMVILTRYFYQQHDMLNFSTWEAMTIPPLRELADELSRHSTEDLGFKLAFTGPLGNGSVIIWAKNGGAIKIYASIEKPPMIGIAGSGLYMKGFPQRIPSEDGYGFYIETSLGRVSFQVVMNGTEPILVVNNTPIG